MPSGKVIRDTVRLIERQINELHATRDLLLISLAERPRRPPPDDPVDDWAAAVLIPAGSSLRRDLVSAYNRWAAERGLPERGARSVIPKIRQLFPDARDYMTAQGERYLLGLSNKTDAKPTVAPRRSGRPKGINRTTYEENVRAYPSDGADRF